MAASSLSVEFVRALSHDFANRRDHRVRSFEGPPSSTENSHWIRHLRDKGSHVDVGAAHDQSNAASLQPFPQRT